MEINDVASDHREVLLEARLDIPQGDSGKMQIGIRSRLKPSDRAAMRLGLAEFEDDVGFERIQATQPAAPSLRRRALPLMELTDLHA